MNETCPLCETKSVGYIVSFPSIEVQSEVRLSIPTVYTEQFQLLSDTEMWFHQRLLYSSIPYWTEFANPDGWTFIAANRDASGRFVRGATLTVAEIAASRPAMWVKEMISHNQIRMMYQPIVSLDEGVSFGYEMLARGVTGSGEVISPFQLYQTAREQNELFHLDRACRIAAIQAGGKLNQEQAVFINFVPTSIYIPEHCLQTTVRAANAHGVARNRVVFEVVETDRVEDLNHLKNILDYYHAQGFRYALDDVGEGYNDLSMLQFLEPDVVKLDKKFAIGIQFDKEKRVAAEAVLKQSNAIGAIALAEGIEQPEEARILGEMGYRWQQGYLYGRPAWEPAAVTLTAR